jgi:NADPH:quinone reductase-like Zn-dependent oxidoreductase
MTAAPVNPSDLLLILGVYGIRPELPARVGAEGVGRIAAVGDGVDAGRVGEQVMLVPSSVAGTWAETVVVDADRAIALPGDADPLQLAMIGINPVTAYLLLHSFVDVQPGQWIAQTVANSAVGRYVIQLAKHAGIKTLNVVRREDAVAPLLDLGGDAVLVSGPEFPAAAAEALGGERPVLVLDGLANETTLQLAGLLADRGTVLSYGGVGIEPMPVSIMDLIFRGVTVRGFWLVTWLRETPADEVRATYERVAELVADGTLGVPIDATFSLDEHQAAIARAAEGGRDGKVLFALA